MKTMTKLFLMIALLGSTAMADGEMGNGGYQPCTVNCPPPPPCESNCLFAGQPSTDTSADTAIQPADVILDFVEEYLILSFLN